MKIKLAILTLYLVLSGCAFKDQNSKNNTFSNGGVIKKTPAKVKIENDQGKWVLIDSIELPSGDYTIDGTVIAKGSVSFPLQYPKFKDTECRGLGYEVSYEQQKKSVTPKILIVPHVNGSERKSDHLIVSDKDTLVIGVYAEYAPLEEFVETETLPSEFVKSLQPSNQCHYMCGQARANPTRALINPDPIPGWGCYFMLLGNGSDRPTSGTTDLWFFGDSLERDDSRESYIKKLMSCDAVRENSDLKSYYQQLTDGPCTYGSQKTMMREWYFVEMKVPYQSPTYSIVNYSEIVKATAVTQSTSISDQPVYPIRAWSN